MRSSRQSPYRHSARAGTGGQSQIQDTHAISRRFAQIEGRAELSELGDDLHVETLSVCVPAMTYPRESLICLQATPFTYVQTVDDYEALLPWDVAKLCHPHPIPATNARTRLSDGSPYAADVVVSCITFDDVTFDQAAELWAEIDALAPASMDAVRGAYSKVTGHPVEQIKVRH